MDKSAIDSRVIPAQAGIHWLWIDDGPPLLRGDERVFSFLRRVAVPHPLNTAACECVVTACSGERFESV